MADLSKFPWVTVDPTPILGEARPSTAKELVEGSSKSEAGVVYYELYREWLRDKKFTLQRVLESEEQDWDRLMTIATKGVRALKLPNGDTPQGIRRITPNSNAEAGYKSWVKSLEGKYKDFYKDLGLLKDHLKEEVKKDPDAAKKIATDFAVKKSFKDKRATFGGEENLDAEIVMASALIQGSISMVEKVNNAYNKYAAVAKLKSFSEKVAVEALELIGEGKSKYQSAQANLRMARDNVSKALETLEASEEVEEATDLRAAFKKSEPVKILQAEIGNFVGVCKELLEGLNEAAIACKKWAKKSTAKKIEKGFQDVYPSEWAALQATKVAASAIGTIISMAFPPAALVGAGLSLGATVGEIAYIKDKAKKAAQDVDTVEEFLNVEFENRREGLFEKVLKKAGRATEASELGGAFAKTLYYTVDGVSYSAALAGAIIAPIAFAFTAGEVALDLADPQKRKEVYDRAKPEEAAALDSLLAAVRMAYQQADFRFAFSDLDSFRNITIESYDGTDYTVNVAGVEGTIAADTGRFSTKDRASIFRLVVGRAYQNRNTMVMTVEKKEWAEDGALIYREQKGGPVLQEAEWKLLRESDFKEAGGRFLVEDFLVGGEKLDVEISADGAVRLVQPPQDRPPKAAKKATKAAAAPKPASTDQQDAPAPAGGPAAAVAVAAAAAPAVAQDVVPDNWKESVHNAWAGMSEKEVSAQAAATAAANNAPAPHPAIDPERVEQIDAWVDHTFDQFGN